ncbi:MAG: site-2 protease family protein [Verrucomicrobiota bacterium]
MFSICVHEYAHAITAYKLGDSTAADEGHLTLNPMVQMGPISIVMLLLIGIGWGMVPVDERNFSKRYHHAIVSIAGPLSNLLLCLICGICAGICQGALGFEHKAVNFFAIAGTVNGALFLLNMIPIPPLDGWSVLGGFVPKLRELDSEWTSHFSWLLLFVLIFSPVISIIFKYGTIMTRIVSSIVLSLF